MKLNTSTKKNMSIQNFSSRPRDSGSLFRIRNPLTSNTPLIRKEPIMRRAKTSLLLTLILVFVCNSLSLSTEYIAFSGFNDADYQTCKYTVQGLMKALDDMGLDRIGYWWSSPYHFWENSMTTWSYDEQLDPAWADYPCLTIIDGNANTYRDAAGRFYFIIETRNEWKGKRHISNLEKYGAPMRLGESFLVDSIQGHCRYVMVLGSNTVASGPNRGSWTYPNYSRPDLLQQDNPYHANPFKIWGPVMTDGVRLVMGFTGHAYAGETDYENWKRFKYYHDRGFSIAWSFANAALDADARHIPVALAQGASYGECSRRINDERWFVCDDPRSFASGRPGTGFRVYRKWHSEPLANEINFSSADAFPDQRNALVGDVKQLDRSAYIYESMDSKKKEAEAIRKYLGMFDLGNSDSKYDHLRGQTTYQSHNQNGAYLDSADGSFLYRNPEVYTSNDNASALTRSECIDMAFSLLVDHDIVKPKELALDRVFSVSQTMVSQDDITGEILDTESEVLGYVIVFKRRLGDLPILSNQVDTIRIEMTRSGEVASLISNYRHGRVLTRHESVTSSLTDVQSVQAELAWLGAVDAVEAGLLPLENGDYVPVYKVTTTETDSSAMPSPQVQYLRQDTLEPVPFVAASAIDSPEAEDDGME
jgi:hypothetical protein